MSKTTGDRLVVITGANSGGKAAAVCGWPGIRPQGVSVTDMAKEWGLATTTLYGVVKRTQTMHGSVQYAAT